jgi:hypothetical protein
MIATLRAEDPEQLEKILSGLFASIKNPTNKGGRSPVSRSETFDHYKIQVDAEAYETGKATYNTGVDK